MKRQRLSFNSPEFKGSYSEQVAIHVEGSDSTEETNNFTRHKTPLLSLQSGYSYTLCILGAYCDDSFVYRDNELSGR